MLSGVLGGRVSLRCSVVRPLAWSHVCPISLPPAPNPDQAPCPAPPFTSTPTYPPTHLPTPLLAHTQVLPVERGAGLAQYGMRVAQSRLAAGDWVHIFPEGTRSRTGKMGPVR